MLTPWRDNCSDEGNDDARDEESQGHVVRNTERQHVEAGGSSQERLEPIWLRNQNLSAAPHSTHAGRGLHRAFRGHWPRLRAPARNPR